MSLPAGGEHQNLSLYKYHSNPLTMAAKSAACREAPPIRPPSKSVCAKISAAFAGFTLPHR